MVAPYDARKIANLLLDRFDSTRWEISNKKINKLLYFIHGVSLVRLQYGLVRNHFEAWDHGPVVAVVFHEFKKFEYRPIEHRAKAFDYASNKEEILGYDDLDVREVEFITRVTKYYVKYSADDLEAMSHEPDSPWSIVRATPAGERGIRDRIPDDLIQRYFAVRLGPLKSVN